MLAPAATGEPQGSHRGFSQPLARWAMLWLALFAASQMDAEPGSLSSPRKQTYGPRLLSQFHDKTHCLLTHMWPQTRELLWLILFV